LALLKPGFNFSPFFFAAADAANENNIFARSAVVCFDSSRQLYAMQEKRPNTVIFFCQPND